MTRKRRRLYMVLGCAVGLGTASALALSAMSSNITFFITPSQIADRAPPPGHVFRLGGMVERGSVHREMVDGHPEAQFAVGDGKSTVDVSYKGVLPDLFREGQGIVAIGSITRGGSFRASEVLAKHSENYMPPEVVNALKASGKWNPDSGKPPPPAATWDGLDGRVRPPSPGAGQVTKAADEVPSPALRERSAQPKAQPAEGRTQ
jgi:cytochrome c-type biogenesis protein CcmE